ncbi:MAG: hypothetical protein KF745_10675 [Phycisphaeraceae bacterium]|nr:hypothetical protein [Phycisphaeraceae bacterium]
MISQYFEYTTKNIGSGVLIRVTYVAPSGCAAYADCQFEISPDSDGDGIPDWIDPDPYNPDTDGDSIPDGCEVRLGTSPTDAQSKPDNTLDTDRDGLSDIQEICDFHTDPRRFDTDGDGVQDLAEIELGLNPLQPRTGEFGLLDSQRVEYLLRDADRDGVYDEFELKIGLDPGNADTDQDGVPDGWELARGFDPLDPSSVPPIATTDTDGDGLTDAEEMFIYRTNPSIADTDGDSVPDGWEVSYGFNPLDPTDGSADLDGDGLGNAQEFGLGTDPTQRDTDGDGADDGVEISQHSDPLDVADGGWAPFEGDTFVGEMWYFSTSARWTIQVGPYRTTTSESYPTVRGASSGMLLSTWRDYTTSIKYSGRPSWFDTYYRECGDGTSFYNGYCYLAASAIGLEHPIMECVGPEPQCQNPLCETYRPCDNDNDNGWLTDQNGLWRRGNDRFYDCTPGLPVRFPGTWRVRFRRPSDPARAIALSIDSDNNSGYGVDRSVSEEAAESHAPGKVVFIAAGDSDRDGVPDYADGLGRTDANGSPWGTPSSDFTSLVPIVVDLGPFDNISEMTVSFEYSASSPAELPARIAHGDSPVARWYEYPLPPLPDGHLRLWRGQARQPGRTPGDFIKPGVHYAVSQLAPGMQAGERRTITVFVEAIRPVDTIANALSVQAVMRAGTTVIGSDIVYITPARLTVYDLRYWGPATDPNTYALTLENRNLDDPSVAHPSSEVGGAITDGASVCLLRVTPPDLNVELRLSVFPRGGLAVCEIPTHFGGFSGTAKNETELELPSLPMPFVPPDGTIGYSCQTTMTDQKAFYVPPASYLDPFYNPEVCGILNSQETCEVYFGVEVNGYMQTVIPFKLRRPPIVLVHGLFGSAGDYWHSSQYNELYDAPLPTRLYFVDYEYKNLQGYDASFMKVPLKIREALHDYRTANDDIGPHTPWLPNATASFQHLATRAFFGIKYAATRADVVGHSMGGQITRAYISGVDGIANRNVFLRSTMPRANWPMLDFRRHAPVAPFDPSVADDGRWRYIRDDNYLAGDIRRFITIGSPFKGSPLADGLVLTVTPGTTAEKRLWGARYGMETWAGGSPQVAEDFFSRLYKPGRSDLPTAIADLASDSVARALLTGESIASVGGMGYSASYPTGYRAVPWIPLGGIAAGYHPQTEGRDLLQISSRNFVSRTVFDTLTVERSDLVVNIESQLNGAGEPGPNQHLIHKVFGATQHSRQIIPVGAPGETQSTPIREEIARLLSRGLLDFNTTGLDK